MAKILVVDDDIAIRTLIEVNLKMQGHTIRGAKDGIEGFALAVQEQPELIILDVMMPNADGFSTCQRLKKEPKTAHIPVLMLTALGVVDDKVKGFDAGADDYLVKPFEIPELQVRVRALLRRYGSLPASASAEIRTVGDLTLIPENLEVKVLDKIIKLTPTEFEILNCLIQNHQQTLSLGRLLQEVWGYSPDDDADTIRVHVRHLRSKLEKASPEKKYIETIYGGGYRLLPDGLSDKVKP
jgi:two-component system, OmpR family, response regulator RpaA